MPSPTRRPWLALAVLVIPVLLISIDMSVLSIAIPAISEDLQPSTTQLLWIVDIYSLLLAGLLVPMGYLGDTIGRRRLLLLGASVFGLASLGAAFAASPAMLIAARLVLGVGGATLMPATLALIRTIFPDPDKRRVAIAVWAAAFSVGAAAGPLLGGLLLGSFHWGAVFLINVPVMLVLLPSALLLVPESRPGAGAKIDLTSVFLVLTGMLGAVWSIKEAVHQPRLVIAPVALIAVALLIAFVRRQRGLAHPMLELSLFMLPRFRGALATNTVMIFSVVGVMFFLPQYFLLVWEMSPFEVGLYLLPLAISTVVGAVLSPFLLRFFATRTIISGGLLLASAGLTLCAALILSEGTLIAVCAGTVLLGLGSGFAETLTNDVILEAAPEDRAGAASAISETGYELGGALGTALLGSLGMGVYAAKLAAALPELPASALQTLGGAHRVAEAGEPAYQLVTEANYAFAAGSATACLAAGILCAAIALYAAYALRVRA
ncbi:MFS transporter [Dermabacteraceae bacterium TAE3-ERU27]|nr:MFS transporter [Dermabacteraceae bacterium TAE3-ERU27]